MARNTGGQDRHDAKALAQCQGSQHRAFLDAQHGHMGLDPQGVQAWIAKTGHDKCRWVRQSGGLVQQRRNDQIGLALILDPFWALGQGCALDRHTKAAQGVQRRADPRRHIGRAVGVHHIDRHTLGLWGV